jgi:YHS domain-containing protein
MGDLTDLDKKIRQRLAESEAAKQRCREQVEKNRIDIERRFSEFGATADRLVATVIRPRLEHLARHFHNAVLVAPDQSSRYEAVCRFKHTERFPATVTLTLSITHDERVEQLIGRYDLEILPVFFQFDRSDQLVQSLENVREEELANWIDQKLIHFIDAYLRLEMADAYQRDGLVTDPICGSRITKTCAAAQEVSNDATVFFCSKTCHQKFIDQRKRS